MNPEIIDGHLSGLMQAYEPAWGVAVAIYLFLGGSWRAC